MEALTAKDAKYGLGRLIDLARAESAAVAKHGPAPSLQRLWTVRAAEGIGRV